jgi:hypothetical protein
MGWHTSHCSLVNTDLTVSLQPAYPSNPTAYDSIPGGRVPRLVPSRTPATLKSLRSRVGVGVGGLVTLDIYPDTDLDGVEYPPTLVVGARCALALIGHLISRTFGFSLIPVPVGTPPAEAIVRPLMPSAARQHSVLSSANPSISSPSSCARPSYRPPG